MSDAPRPFLRTLPKVSLLCLAIPVAIGMHFAGFGGIALFFVSGAAILGTVTLIGKATEEYALYAGPVWGGLMNATFGNVTELIIALFALQAGLHDLVRSSITGSILGNLLLVLGGAMTYGGMYHPTLKFSRAGASANVGMLVLALVTLAVPSFVAVGWRTDPSLDESAAASLTSHTSIAAAVILLAVYVLSLVFSLRTHRFLLMPSEHGEHEKPEWSKRTAIGVLLGATVAVAFLSDVFVESVQHVVEVWGVSEIFLGVIVVAVVGNAAEGMVAVFVAKEGKMELSFQIAMGSCLQVALMVAPMLVLASIAFGNPMTLAFNVFELLALGGAVLIAGYALIDGETHWLEGVMFLAVYAFFGAVFWFHP